jgi:hypothetical protein
VYNAPSFRSSAIKTHSHEHQPLRSLALLPPLCHCTRRNVADLKFEIECRSEIWTRSNIFRCGGRQPEGRVRMAGCMATGGPLHCYLLESSARCHCTRRNVADLKFEIECRLNFDPIEYLSMWGRQPEGTGVYAWQDAWRGYVGGWGMRGQYVPPTGSLQVTLSSPIRRGVM